MNKYTILLAVTGLISLSGIAATDVSSDPASLVNPMIGTGGHGHTFPGAVVPNGMIQPSPDTRLYGWDASSGYFVGDTLISGFSHTHLSGTGCQDLGDILIMPTVGKQVIDGTYPGNTSNMPYASGFSHSNETAEPGYYAVLLNRYGVKAEMTATPRVAIHRFTYPANMDGEAGMIIDLDYSLGLQRNNNMKLHKVSDRELQGFKSTWGWSFPDQDVYFDAVFSQPFELKVIEDTVALHQGDQPRPRCKALLTFPGVKGGDQLLVKVALSPVDCEGAAKNMAAEKPGFDFEGTRKTARDKWNRWLSKIEVPATDNHDDLTKFYTALYHTAIVPNMSTDVDGRYLGMNRKVKHVDESGDSIYHVFSTWDTFRALHPLLTILDPKLNNALAKSLLDKADDLGVYPMWELASNDTGCMIGFHAVSILADVVAKGQNSFDPAHALHRAVLTSGWYPDSVKAHESTVGALMPQAKYYKALQEWVPCDGDNEAVAKALEYAYNDYCVAQLARAAGDKAAEKEFLAKSKYYKHYWDADSRFMRGKTKEGKWRTPFDPRSSNHRNDDYCEGNAWQWTWFVPHDVDGLMELMGGREAFVNKLDSLFTISSELTGEGVSADISGLIGQYAHGNEPSHHITHFYNYARQPWKTQDLVGRIFDEMYANSPDGLIGNEDCGQMSAWLVMNAMGIYQVAPGNPVYSIGRPMFREMTVKLPEGKQMHISAPKLSKENRYVASVKLNGRRIDTPFISHKDFVAGGELTFEMSPKPTKWGTKSKK